LRRRFQLRVRAEIIEHNYTSQTSLTAFPWSLSRRASPARVRPTRTTARPETHQPLHTVKEHKPPDPKHPTDASAPRQDIQGSDLDPPQ